MAKINGLTGLRPEGNNIKKITCPPYDVIKPGSEIESVLKQNDDSLYHITLGSNPQQALGKLVNKGYLKKDNVPCFYVYEQMYGESVRRGILTATEVTDYKEGEVIRHEKTFDNKVKGRLELRGKTGYTFEPVFLLTKAHLRSVLDEVIDKYDVEYEFVSDFNEVSELHGISNRIYRVEEESREGKIIKEIISSEPLYIADGHHRYHAALLNRQTHCLAYICECTDARILAYNRVINGVVDFEKVKDKLSLISTEKFVTPEKHSFTIYTKRGTYIMKACNIPNDVVGKLDCSILERELYPQLGLNHDMITDSRYFDYYSEDDLEKMKECVNLDKYNLALALHPVSIQELMEVADAGIVNNDIVMPEKSTFFAPKILSGIFIYKHINA